MSSARRSGRAYLCTLFFSALLSTAAVLGQGTPSTKLYGHINKLGAVFVSSGVIPQSTQMPTIVLKVRIGSPAYYAGLQAGDQILVGNVGQNLLSLKIQRNGQIFFAKLRAKTDETTIATPPLVANVDSLKLWSALRKFDVTFLVDHSGSMSAPIPGSGQMRWQWIKEQLKVFCEEAEKKADSSFTLALFNNVHSIKHDLNKDDLVNILNRAVTTGDTSMAPALSQVLQDHAVTKAGKGLLLVIITDGLTLSSKENSNLLLQYAEKNKGKQFQVVCIQAGYSEEGAEFVSSLKRNCASHGMADSIHGLLFQDVSQAGISPFLAKFITP